MNYQNGRLVLKKIKKSACTFALSKRGFGPNFSSNTTIFIMQISTRHREGVTILDLKGKITIGVGDVALREAIHDALDSGSKQILLNMANVSLMDSSGIGELVSAYTNSTNRGARLRICNLPAKIQDILQITQLITVFEVFDTEDEAVASFA